MPIFPVLVTNVWWTLRSNDKTHEQCTHCSYDKFVFWWCNFLQSRALLGMLKVSHHSATYVRFGDEDLQCEICIVRWELPSSELRMSNFLTSAPTLVGLRWFVIPTLLRTHWETITQLKIPRLFTACYSGTFEALMYGFLPQERAPIGYCNQGVANRAIMHKGKCGPRSKRLRPLQYIRLISKL